VRSAGLLKEASRARVVREPAVETAVSVAAALAVETVAGQASATERQPG
jgi:hypothetical protein